MFPEAYLKIGIKHYLPGNFRCPNTGTGIIYTKNGVPINEDKTWDYANRYTLKTGDEANKYYIGNGLTTVKAHFDREPRFYADLGFDGGVWFGNGNLDQDKAYILQGRGPQSLAAPKLISG